jgi:hypothetical protein
VNWLKLWLIWVFSCGWLAPMGLGLYLVADWAERIVMPSIRAGASNEGQHSFLPYDLAKQSLGIAFLWLAVVVMYWAYRATRPANER